MQPQHTSWKLVRACVCVREKERMCVRRHEIQKEWREITDKVINRKVEVLVLSAAHK